MLMKWDMASYKTLTSTQAIVEPPECHMAQKTIVNCSKVKLRFDLWSVVKQ